MFPGWFQAMYSRNSRQSFPVRIPMSKLAQRTQGIKPSVTLAIAAKAGKLRAEGVDVANFSAGEPDFDTPEHIKAAAVEALRRGMTKYTDVRGIEPLREAVAQ